MCGIAGIKAKIDSRDSALKRMLEPMVVRGPDGEGDYFDNDIALGHRRLRIIDLSPRGDQPMSNEHNDIFIVFNGEIYNFKELRGELEAAGHRFKSQTDTEVIIHGYEEWGEGCLHRLRGMFAFGIWDRGKKELLLARDRLGIKPLYYYHKDGTLIFASQVRAILASGIVKKQIDGKGLSAYLERGCLEQPATLVENIRSLLPGHYIVANDSRVKIMHYWEPPKQATDGGSLNIGEVREKINTLLKESMKQHLISDAPLGIFLSGGIDSSSILNMASKVSSHIKRIAIVFKEKALNESMYSRLVAERYHADHKEIFIDENYLLGHLPAVIYAMDQPTFDGVNTYVVSKIAKESGLTVALSGLGGDEIFCGYSTFKRAMALDRFYSLWDKCPRAVSKMLSKTLAYAIPPSSPRDKLMELIEPPYSTTHSYAVLRRLFSENQKRLLLKTGYLPEHADNGDLSSGADIINQISLLETTSYMRDVLLPDTDCMSMAHSLEVRVPLLDNELVEYMLSIPGRFKIDKTVNKPLLVRSLDEPLPEAVFKRRKMGFVFPLGSWLKQNLKTEVEQVLREENVMVDEFLEHDAVVRIWEGFLKGHVSWQRPWAIYVLKRWIKAYLQ